MSLRSGVRLRLKFVGGSGNGGLMGERLQTKGLSEGVRVHSNESSEGVGVHSKGLSEVRVHSDGIGAGVAHRSLSSSWL